MFKGAKYLLLVTALIISINIVNSTQLYGWRQLGSGNNNGVNGSINVITELNGKIIIAGIFTLAGGVSVNNIAQWDPNNSVWTPLGNGLNDTVYSLYVYNSQLYAAGNFTQSGVTSVNRIARWNGTSWQPLGSGLNGDGMALVQYGNDLIVGGAFSAAGGSAANKIAKWNGSSWSALGSGISGSNSKVYSLQIFNSSLIAGGSFSSAGGNSANNIAKWNGFSWSALSQGTDGSVYALTVYDGDLAVGGDFNHAGGDDAENLAKWTGNSWGNIGNSHTFESGPVYALIVFKDDLIVGGGFRKAGNLYVDRITRFNGSSWFRMQTGMSGKVRALYVDNSIMYAGGEFKTAGGRHAGKIARWINEQIVSVSGSVRYADNNAAVAFGKVKMFRLDLNTRELIVVDSAYIIGGIYILTNVLRDSFHIVVGFPDDELDFVPTIYPSAIDWRNGLFVNTNVNQININIKVLRISPQSAGTITMGGNVFLNIDPQLNPAPRDFPFLSGSIVYIKQGDLFRRFAVSNTDESYSTGVLNPGTYEVFVSRIGYTSASRTVALNVSTDTVDFYLDTLNIVGLHNISSTVPKEYLLSQNYPNPFNPVTSITFSLPEDGFTELKIFDLLGREISILVNQYLKRGEYRYIYDAGNLSSGLYFYSLTAGDGSFKQTRKMVLIK